MSKKFKIIAGISVVCLIVISVIVCVVILQKKQTDQPMNPSVEQFGKYLEENGYSVSNGIYSMQSKIENDSITETYTESYNLKAHIFTSSFVRYDASKDVTTEMEYVYNYADDTVTVNQYDTEDSRTKGKPDTVYILNRSEIVECIEGNGTADETELYNTIIQFKEVFKKHIEKSGVLLDDMKKP